MPIIAGVDEAGRGPLAGPVVAAAVITEDTALLNLMKDSKKLTEKARELLYKRITQDAIWAVGLASVEEIDKINILQASLLAMKRAVEKLTPRPESIWVDGKHAPKMPIDTQCHIQGDNRFPIIGAASIVAKVTRDNLMRELALQYPDYGFEKHKGYGTKAHLTALEAHGVLPVHRRSFSPISKMIEAYV